MRNPLVVALAAVLFVECALVGFATIYLVVETLAARPASYLSAIGLAALAAFAAIWVGFIGAGVLRGRAWIRGAAITWQVIQVVIGVGCLQGLFASPPVGVLLIVLAVAVVVLVFTRPVIAATSDREPRGQS